MCLARNCISEEIHAIVNRCVARGEAMGSISPPPSSESCTKRFQVNEAFDV